MTGFISPVSSSSTQSALAKTPLMASATAVSNTLVAGLSLAALPDDLILSLRSDCGHLLQSWLELCGTKVMATMLLNTGSLSLRVIQSAEQSQVIS
jgi:hypothetical protein